MHLLSILVKAVHYLLVDVAVCTYSECMWVGFLLSAILVNAVHYVDVVVQ
jgi:hypothetical protein